MYTVLFSSTLNFLKQIPCHCVRGTMVLRQVGYRIRRRWSFRLHGSSHNFIRPVHALHPCPGLKLERGWTLKPRSIYTLNSCSCGLFYLIQHTMHTGLHSRPPPHHHTVYTPPYLRHPGQPSVSPWQPASAVDERNFYRIDLMFMPSPCLQSSPTPPPSPVLCTPTHPSRQTPRPPPKRPTSFAPCAPPPSSSSFLHWGGEYALSAPFWPCHRTPRHVLPHRPPPLAPPSQLEALSSGMHTPPLSSQILILNNVCMISRLC